MSKKLPRERVWPTYKRLLVYIRGYWLAFVLGLAGTGLYAGFDASFSYFIKPILDKGFIDKNQTFINWLPVAIIVIFILRGVASFMSSYFMSWIGRQVVMRFRQDIFRHYLHLPASFYDKHSSGELLSALIYNVDQVSQASSNSLVTLVYSFCLVIGLLVVMFINSWQLSLIFLFVVPLITFVVRYSSRRLRKISLRVQDSMGDITHIAEESIEGFRVVKTFGGLQYESEKFAKATERTRRQQMKQIVTNTLSTSGVQFVIACVIALVIFLATSSIAKTSLSAGSFMSMVTALIMILKPMKNFNSVNNAIQRGIAAAGSIFTLLDTPLEIDEGNKSLESVKGELAFKDVGFSYVEGRPVLKDINFTVAPGKTYALVGRSGSGKSTLVALIPRFYNLNEGDISLDGCSINELSLLDLRKHIALVSQHVTLFNDTIAHNIAYGRLGEANEAEIIAAAEAAYAMDFINEMPEGLQTEIGDNGVLLSGGQRQRIAIARAILKDAPLLILDEATSALDTESERKVQAALDRLMENRTTIVVAHRLSTIEKADCILVMKHGDIVERGTHSELLAQGGYYKTLYDMQFQDT